MTNFERVGVEILRDRVKAITSKVKDDHDVVVLTRYGTDIAALVPVGFLQLFEEIDLLERSSARGREYFLDERGCCEKCGSPAPKSKRAKLFGSWHEKTCSRWREK